MVGLSVVLENQKSHVNSSITKKTPQVISKTSMLVTTGRRSSGSRPPPPPPVHFLPPPFPDHCCLCHQKLLPGKDIYMYQGDRAFCSVDCRYTQILMDDQEESTKRSCCSFAAIKSSPTNTTTASAASSSSSASAAASGCRRKAVRNRAGGFAY